MLYRIKELDELLRASKEQIDQDNLAMTALRKQKVQSQKEKDSLNKKFERFTQKLESLEKEMIEKDKKNQALNRKLEQRVLTAAEDYKMNTLRVLAKQDSMRSSL